MNKKREPFLFEELFNETVNELVKLGIKMEITEETEREVGKQIRASNMDPSISILLIVNNTTFQGYVFMLEPAHADLLATVQTKCCHEFTVSNIPGHGTLRGDNLNPSDYNAIVYAKKLFETMKCLERLTRKIGKIKEKAEDEIQNVLSGM